MGAYNVHAGHCPDGKGASGAVGYLKESTEARKVKDEVIRLLKEQGHTAYDCTCEDNTTQNGCLNIIVSKCNSHEVVLDVSIHLNAGGGTGVEVYYYTNAAKAVAERIVNKIAEQTGYKNRGAKYGSFYVLRKTKATAVLVECCFVDNQADADNWNVNKMAAAIVSGMLSKDVATNTGNISSSSTSTPANNSTATTTKANDWVTRLQEECNAQGFSNQKVDGVPGKNTLAGCPACRSGARGNITKLLQEKLNSLGYNCGTADGIFGTKTKAAVIAYQKAKGLSQDGIVGQNTWSKLLGLS